MQKATELWMGKRGAMYWMNQSALWSVGLLLGGWVVFRWGYAGGRGQGVEAESAGASWPAAASCPVDALLLLNPCVAAGSSALLWACMRQVGRLGVQHGVCLPATCTFVACLAITRIPSTIA